MWEIIRDYSIGGVLGLIGVGLGMLYCKVAYKPLPEDDEE